MNGRLQLAAAAVGVLALTECGSMATNQSAAIPSQSPSRSTRPAHIPTTGILLVPARGITMRTRRGLLTPLAGPVNDLAVCKLPSFLPRRSAYACPDLDLRRQSSDVGDRVAGREPDDGSPALGTGWRMRGPGSPPAPPRPARGNGRRQLRQLEPLRRDGPSCATPGRV
jgi:hypothetical protein